MLEETLTPGLHFVSGRNSLKDCKYQEPDSANGRGRRELNQAVGRVKIGVTENPDQVGMERKQWIQVMEKELARGGKIAKAWKHHCGLRQSATLSPQALFPIS